MHEQRRPLKDDISLHGIGTPTFFTGAHEPEHPITHHRRNPGGWCKCIRPLHILKYYTQLKFPRVVVVPEGEIIFHAAQMQ